MLVLLLMLLLLLFLMFLFWYWCCRSWCWCLSLVLCWFWWWCWCWVRCTFGNFEKIFWRKISFCWKYINRRDCALCALFFWENGAKWPGLDAIVNTDSRFSQIAPYFDSIFSYLWIDNNNNGKIFFLRSTICERDTKMEDARWSFDAWEVGFGGMPEQTKIYARPTNSIRPIEVYKGHLLQRFLFKGCSHTQEEIVHFIDKFWLYSLALCLFM